MAKIRFLFDFISPYAYLGWTQVHLLAERHQASVEPVPVLFAAMLDRYGHRGPAEIPPKRAYIFKNVLRLAHGFGVPLLPPPAHPFNPLLALRIASLPSLAEHRRGLIDALYRATWAGGPGVTDPREVAGVVSSVGLDGDAIVAEAQTPAAKARVREQTEQAIELGAFGVPTFVIDGELFWGVDAMPHIEGFLAGSDPVDSDALARWAELPVESARKAVSR